MQTLKLTKKYEKYPEYKDSGVEWFGMVPKCWSVGPLRSVLDERIEKNTNLVSNNILSVMKDVGVIRYADKGDIGNKSSDRPENYKIVHAGDIVLNSMNLVIGSVGQAKEMGVTSSVYIIYYPRNKEISSDYYHYLFRDKNWQKTLGRLGRGIMELREAIKSYDLKIEPVPIPTLNDQKKIVVYLNEKTATIDQIIEKKQKLIELLREKRTAVINQAVTKGLNPKAEFVESGIDWIGRIPKGWSIKKLKFIGEAIIGLTYSPEDITDESGTLVLRSSNVQSGLIELGDNVFVKSDIPKKLITQIGDILICSRNGSKSLIGKNAFIDKKSEGLSFGAFMTVFRTKNWRFVSYFLNSNLFMSQLSSTLTSTINQLTTHYLNNILIAIAPEREQSEIVEYLHSKLENYDKAVFDVEKSIETLQEFKSSLISSVVTGKIKI